MKITRVEAVWLQVPIAEERQHVSDFGRATTFDMALVRIETDAGITGVGEAKVSAGGTGDYHGVVAVINNEFAPGLIGQDPRNITQIWESLYNGTRGHYALARGHVFPAMSRRGVSISAISGIDIALWDILGKSLGVPVWQLLGGRKAERMPAYASGGWADARGIGAQLMGYVGQGDFKAVKMRIGVFDGSPAASAERVIAAREALGPGIDLMVDAHGTFTVSEAKQFCHLVRDCDLAWFEEPVTADDKRGLAEVRAGTHIPIASGESECTRFDFRDLIECAWRRHPAARPRHLRRHHRGDAHFGARRARRTCAWHRTCGPARRRSPPACMWRRPRRPPHSRVLAGCEPDDPRAGRRELHGQRRHARDPRPAGPGHHDSR